MSAALWLAPVACIAAGFALVRLIDFITLPRSASRPLP